MTERVTTCTSLCPSCNFLRYRFNEMFIKSIFQTNNAFNFISFFESEVFYKRRHFNKHMYPYNRVVGMFFRFHRSKWNEIYSPSIILSISYGKDFLFSCLVRLVVQSVLILSVWSSCDIFCDGYLIIFVNKNKIRETV